MRDRNRLFWNEAAETLSAEEIRSLQVGKIPRQIAYCYDRSLYYREKFQHIGVKPDDIRTWEDFRRLPVMLTPSEFRAQQEQSLTEDGHPYGRILCADLDQGAYLQFARPLQHRLLDILDDEAHLNDAVQGLTEIQQHGAFLYPLAAQIFRSQERPDGFFVPMG